MHLVYLVLANTNGIGVRLFLYAELVLGRRAVVRVGYWVNFHGGSASIAGQRRYEADWCRLNSWQEMGSCYPTLAWVYVVALRPRARWRAWPCLAGDVNAVLVGWWRKWGYPIAHLVVWSHDNNVLLHFNLVTTLSTAIKCCLLFNITAFISVDNGRDWIASLRAWRRDF